jgi:hypothetical protein
MRNYTLALLLLALTQAGCSIEEGGGLYEPVSLTNESQERLERYKRELLTIEDTKLGEGPLAAWGRKISADIEVRYIDGAVIYRGPMFYYSGFTGSVFIHDASKKAGNLSVSQAGIWLGINGMSVGGKRRFTIDREFVSAGLLIQGRKPNDNIGVREERLTVEATLTDSCIPRILRFLRVGSSFLIEQEIGCRDADLPKRDPNAPLWHLY